MQIVWQYKIVFKAVKYIARFFATLRPEKHVCGNFAQNYNILMPRMPFGKKIMALFLNAQF